MTTLPYIREGSGPTFVLVHGYLGAAEQWAREIAHFASSFDVIAPNLPGFGAAADREGCTSVEAMADAVLGLLDELGVDEFRLLGHSMGGMIVQEMARKRPTQVVQLILYGTGPLGLMPNRFEPLSTSKERLLADGVAASIRRVSATWFKKGAGSPGHDFLSEIGAKASKEAAIRALDAMAEWDGRGALASLPMPTLIVWGDTDRSYRWPQVETLWSTLPDVRLAVMPDTSHAANLEKPDLFLALVEDFLTEPMRTAAPVGMIA